MFSELMRAAHSRESRVHGTSNYTPAKPYVPVAMKFTAKLTMRITKKIISSLKNFLLKYWDMSFIECV